jgi:hypothetical protein
MAHYAFIDTNNIVVEVITGRNEDEIVDGISDWEKHYEQFRPGLICKRTSYNENIRKNFAGIGFIYDPTLDIFLEPKPYPSWVVSAEKRNWVAPVAKPDSGFWLWNEETKQWDEEENR